LHVPDLDSPTHSSVFGDGLSRACTGVRGDELLVWRAVERDKCLRGEKRWKGAFLKGKKAIFSLQGLLESL
jgi:hypothetical protein